MIASDIDTFLGADDFAILGTFEGTEISLLIDKVAEENYILDIATCDTSDVKGITTSSVFVIDEITYTASSWVEREGVMEIVLNVQN